MQIVNDLKSYMFSKVSKGREQALQKCMEPINDFNIVLLS